MTFPLLLHDQVQARETKCHLISLDIQPCRSDALSIADTIEFIHFQVVYVV